jgi:hypothetical protein
VREELTKLRKKCQKQIRGQGVQDPLLTKLTSYHNRLSSYVDNVVTEKLSAEVREVVLDVSKIDDVSRPFRWTKEDEATLNRLNADAKKLQTPQKWTWAAKHGTDQYEYNHKRMEYLVEHELQTIVRHCERCKCTGILVGADQLDSLCCYDCIVDNRLNEKVRKEKTQAWESVRPRTMEYPKRTEQGHELEDLPELYPGYIFILLSSMALVQNFNVLKMKIIMSARLA